MGRLSYIIYIVFFMFFCIQNALSQSTDRNYVKSENLAEAVEWGDIIDRGGIDNISHTTEVVYYDGLGRPVLDISNISGQTKEDGTVEQIVHYYPFGGTFNDAGLNTGLQQNKYNGKELDRVAGLNTYDYGARQYFSALPVWDRVDPKCEKYYNISPYAYCANNPVNRIDVDGKDWFYTRNGTFLGSDFKSTDNIIIRELNIKALGSPSWQKKCS